MPDQSIRLYDWCKPALATGTHKLEIGLTISSGHQPPQKPPQLQLVVEPAGHDQVAAAIVDRHPAIGARGNFRHTLPHVAFRRRTLPWETGQPWLALVVIPEDEWEAAIVGDAKSPQRFKPKWLSDFGPDANELPLLTHLRQTGTPGGEDEDEIAVVVANRVAPPDNSLNHPADVRYLACLVDLSPTGNQAVIHWWPFVSTGAESSFLEYAQRMDLHLFPAAATKVQGVDRDGNPPEKPMTYHGPLVPGPMRGNLAGFSAAAARNLGRLLAMADQRFQQELAAWLRDAETQRRSKAACAAISAELLPAGITIDQLSQLPDILKDRLARRLASRTEDGPRPSPIGTLPPIIVGHGRKRPLPVPSGAVAPAAMPTYVAETLKDWRLLRGVPLWYLMTPEQDQEEALWTFVLDTRWIEALLSGALEGTGVTPPRQSPARRFAELKDGTPISKLLQEVVLRHLGGLSKGEQWASDTVGGFLIRSPLVEHWPDMAVIGLRNKSPLLILRRERLAPSVMMVLFNGVPDTIDLRQPGAGLTFTTAAPRTISWHPVPAATRTVVDVVKTANGKSPANLAADLMVAPARVVFSATDEGDNP